MLDFAQIKKTPITDVLSLLDITLRQDGEQLRGWCPISKTPSTGRAPFIVTPAKNAFICFCPECKKLSKQGGDCIELVARVRKLPARDAAAFIVSKGKGADKPDDNPSPQQTEAPAKSSGFDPLAYQATLDPYHDALGDFDQDIIKELGGGYSSKGLNRGRLVLPVRGQSGNIEAFVGIALNGEEPRLLFPKGYQIPYFMGAERISDGVLYVVFDPAQMVATIRAGMDNVLVLLQPITINVLASICALMKTNGCTELEFLG